MDPSPVTSAMNKVHIITVHAEAFSGASSIMTIIVVLGFSLSACVLLLLL
jgi:hypothetical protein